MNSKIIFALSTALISMGIGGYVFFQKPESLPSYTVVPTTSSTMSECQESISQGMMYFSCPDYAIYSRETNTEIIKNIATSNNPPNALIGLVGGKSLDLKFAQISSDVDATFVLSQTPQGLPSITAINSPIRIALKDNDSNIMTTTSLLPGMSVTHNPQINMNGADFFRLTQLISFRVLDITKNQWIDTITPGLNLPELIANSKKIQDGQMRSTLSEIQNLVSPYASLPIETTDDPIRSTLSFNEKQNQIKQEQAIAESITQEISNLQKDTGIITTEKLNQLESIVSSWSSINPKISQEIRTRLTKLMLQSRLQLTRLPENDTFSRIVSQRAQKTLLEQNDLTTADVYRLFQELSQTTNPKDFNRGLSELYIMSELGAIIDQKNESGLMAIVAKSWSNKVLQVIPLIPESSDQRSNLSNLFSQGNEILGAYINQIAAAYFVDTARPYRILERQKSLTNPLLPAQLEDIDETIKALTSITDSTQNTWYAISDSYDYSAKDPHKILTENLSALKDILFIFRDFRGYSSGKANSSEQNTANISEVLTNIGIKVQPELIDPSTSKYRILDGAASESIVYDILVSGETLNALSVRDTSKNIRLLDTTAKAKLSQLIDFHRQSLPKILQTIPAQTTEKEITLDISGRSFILDGKTYSF